MASSSKDCMHKIKMVQFRKHATPIVLQNGNGPCPLLAICNFLLLDNKLKLSTNIAQVSQKDLLELLRKRLNASNSNVDNMNQLQNFGDALALLPKLTTGIDVNVKYTGIGDFEFTEECTIFDMLGIPLYHGWIVDPKDYDTANAIGSKSYNTLTREPGSLETSREGKLIKSFLENEASQLTSHGLGRLKHKDGVEEGGLCVFFRNNHFSTMFKFEGELYLLAIDEGYINQPDLVWEKLNEVKGTSHMTSNFKEFKLEATQAGLDTNSDEQIAKVLHEELNQQPR